jgi:hypothetical protein
MPPWAAGDEVYGRSSQLRKFLQDDGTGYVMRVGCAFHVDVSAELSTRADTVVAPPYQPLKAMSKCWLESASVARSSRFGMSRSMELVT